MSIRLKALFATLFMLCATMAGSALHAKDEAAPYRWRDVKVGGGGFSPGIIFSRAEKGLAYLRTDIGGAYRWDAKAGVWIPLQDHEAESNYFGIESIAADPRNADIVYMAVGMYKTGPAAMLKSVDRGASWTNVKMPIKMGGNEPGRGLGERLAIDPNNSSILYFGSRHDGLWRSVDAGASWNKAAAFPYSGKALPTQQWDSNAGISFVLFDPASAKDGKSATIYAAVGDQGAQHLYRSLDGGENWSAVPGEPQQGGLLPVKADISDDGQLFVTYANWMGPNGVTKGAVWRFAKGVWADITPQKGASAPDGGYMGISLAHSDPGTIAVATMNRHNPVDTIWLSRDWGQSWIDAGAESTRDVSKTPFLKFDGPDADFGHWMSGLAIDPFEASRIAYTTGATIYATSDWQSRHWQPWTEGVEETAIVAMVSPTEGAHLISGFGDIAGFVHDDLSASPPYMHLTPHLVTTTNLDYGGRAPQHVVRSGRRHQGQVLTATLALSKDGGRHWEPILLPAYTEVGESDPKRHDLTDNPAITISADGKVMAVATPTPLFSSDGGVQWTSGLGAPRNTRPVADKVDPRRFYMIDFEERALFASIDAGQTFRRLGPLPDDLWKARTYNVETPWPLVASPFAAGDLWINIGGVLHRSSNGGKSFKPQSRGDLDIKYFALGKAAPGSEYPAIFAFGAKGGVTGIWRSDDGGRQWLRVNDGQHQWGNRVRLVEGDPRIFGRVYVGTDGRGILYGDPVQ